MERDWAVSTTAAKVAAVPSVVAGQLSVRFVPSPHGKSFRIFAERHLFSYSLLSRAADLP